MIKCFRRKNRADSKYHKFTSSGNTVKSLCGSVEVTWNELAEDFEPATAPLSSMDSDEISSVCAHCLRSTTKAEVSQGSLFRRPSPTRAPAEVEALQRKLRQAKSDATIESGAQKATIKDLEDALKAANFRTNHVSTSIKYVSGALVELGIARKSVGVRCLIKLMEKLCEELCDIGRSCIDKT